MISFKKSFIFIHVPKTGGTAIQSILAPHCIDTIITVPKTDGESQQVPHNKFNISKHSPLFKYKRKLPPEVFPQLKIFACIRNPWDRLISVYFSSHKQLKKWDLFTAKTETIHEMEPLRYYLSQQKCRPETAQMLDFRNFRILSYESLADDFKKLAKELGIDYPNLPIMNVSKREKDYRKYYDAELCAMVAGKFHDEIQYGGYKF
jgi:hypothetical protein